MAEAGIRAIVMATPEHNLYSLALKRSARTYYRQFYFSLSHCFVWIETKIFDRISLSLLVKVSYFLHFALIEIMENWLMTESCCKRRMWGNFNLHVSNNKYENITETQPSISN